MDDLPHLFRSRINEIARALSQMIRAGKVAENEPLPWEAHKALIGLRNTIQEYERTICGGCEMCPPKPSAPAAPQETP